MHLFSPLPPQSLSSSHSCTPTSSILAGPSLPRPLPYGMKPVQLTWQKEVTYDEQGNILDMVKLDPTKFPSHRYMQYLGKFQDLLSTVDINIKCMYSHVHVLVQGPNGLASQSLHKQSRNTTSASNC